MKLRPIAALVLTAFAVLPAAAAVNVRYGNPDHFTDAGDRNNDPVKLMKNFADFMKSADVKSLVSRFRSEILRLETALSK